MSSEVTDIEEKYTPNVQVIWEDEPHNFTQERIKSVKQYFSKKYGTTNINVITVDSSQDDEMTMQTIDVSYNIMDKNYQKSLIDMYLDSKSYNDFAADVYLLDKQVEDLLISRYEDISAFKKWSLKRIEFSNFMSFGENQVIDFTKYNGITVITSNPPNFGGKTVLAVDLLLFLFFNTTTKTTKNEDIFNKFTDKNKVVVKGEVTIDGDDYFIIRTLERKKNKSGDYSVKAELDFIKKNKDGSLQSLTGEQRRETEKFIKSSIGEQEDFLMTILTTGSNLEDLIESKPTARGQILSKFLGLEFLKRKEEIAKEIYSTFSKGLISNIYNKETLKQDIEKNLEFIDTFQECLEIDKNALSEIEEKIKIGTSYREELMASKHTDIDSVLAATNLDTLNSELEKLNIQYSNTIKEMSNLYLVKPDQFYDEQVYDKLNDACNDIYVELTTIDSKISELEELKNSVDGGIKCEHCGIDIINAILVKNKLMDLEKLYQKKNSLVLELETCKKEKKALIVLREKFDLYEKNSLIYSKYEITKESLELKINSAKEKISDYLEIQEKINKNNEIESKLLKAKYRLEELTQAKRKLDEKITFAIVQIKNHHDKIDSNYNFIRQIEEEPEKEKIYKIYLELFGKHGISKYIMKTMLPIINNELQRLLKDSAPFKVEIKISDKNDVEFYMIDNSTGIEKLLNSGSGYEKTISSLAIRSVLSKICSLPKPNIIVMDEVFGKISNDNLELVGNFFFKIREYFEKIFVISHNPMIDNWADNICQIKKSENISELI